MENLTKSEAIRLHRKMWNWIADETLRRKKKVTKAEYFCEMEIPFKNRPIHGCYCCEYDYQKLLHYGGNCKHCPINWRSDVDRCMCENKYNYYDYEGLFGQLTIEKDYEKASQLAREIANLPEK